MKNVIWHPLTNDTQSKICKRIGPLQLYLVLKKKKQEYTTDACSRKETRRISIGQQKKPLLFRSLFSRTKAFT
jgi:hypothetical protein